MNNKRPSSVGIRNILICSTLLFLLCMQTGCARFSSIYRSETLPKDKAQIVSIDAKQRVILSSPAGQTAANGKDTAILRFCMEPPPDVFTAISSSFGLRAALGTEKARQDVGAELQQAMSENAATIARTQTVNVLREMMFRNCERYLSGAIDAQEFIVQAARDQRAIVHVLAIEQLTGAARTQAVALATIAKSSSTGTSTESIKTLQTAFENKLVAEKAAEKARKDAESAEPSGPCQSGADAYADSDADKTKIAAKKSACTAAGKADAAASQSAEHYASVNKAVEKQSALSAEASGDFKYASGDHPDPTVAVANAVERIVKMNDSFNEIEMTCVVLFRNLVQYSNALNQQQARSTGSGQGGRNTFNAKEYADAFSNKCLDYMNAKIIRAAEEDNLDAETMKLERLRVENEIDKLVAASTDNAQIVWNKIVSGNKVDAAKLDALVAKAMTQPLPRHSRAQILAATNFDSFKTAFAGLLDKHQRALATAAK
jgi:hypothetical protein